MDASKNARLSIRYPGCSSACAILRHQFAAQLDPSEAVLDCPDEVLPDLLLFFLTAAL